MPYSCCNVDYDAAFDARTARRQLAAYRRGGASGSTRRLIDELRKAEVTGASLLDIGGGVGVVGFELLSAGAARLTHVDASRAYVAVARREAKHRGVDERAQFVHGDFVGFAEGIEPADIVTLDRVVCCYGDWTALLDASLARSRRLYGLVFPNDRWWIRAGVGLGNLTLRLSRQSFRGFVHPERAIDARIRAAGFEQTSHHRGWLWQTVVYARRSGSR